MARSVQAVLVLQGCKAFPQNKLHVTRLQSAMPQTQFLCKRHCRSIPLTQNGFGALTFLFRSEATNFATLKSLYSNDFKITFQVMV